MRECIWRYVLRREGRGGRVKKALRRTVMTYRRAASPILVKASGAYQIASGASAETLTCARVGAGTAGARAMALNVAAVELVAVVIEADGVGGGGVGVYSGIGLGIGVVVVVVL